MKVAGATGLANTNYEGKAQAAIDALKHDDFVFVHVEATDEAGHDGDLDLKLRAINYLDQRLIKPIYEAIAQMDEPVCMAVLPDHPTPVELRIHVNEPVPFLIYYKGIEADNVQHYAWRAAMVCCAWNSSCRHSWPSNNYQLSIIKELCNITAPMVRPKWPTCRRPL